MRLFIAVNFDDTTKEKLADMQNRLKKYAIKGNFTNFENLHLTLVFLGEIKNSEIIKDIMDKIKITPFTITLNGIGLFKRNGGDILWIGIEKNIQLENVYSNLCDSLREKGFYIEKRVFTPHLTLAREIITTNDFNKHELGKNMESINYNVENIQLMKSERLNGKLKYTPIHTVKFNL